jgi:hypothetical protein
MRAAVCAAVCAACLMAAQLAGAAPQPVATVSGLKGELQLVGPRAAWLEQTADSWGVRAAAPGERPMLLAAGSLAPFVSRDPEGRSVSFGEVRFAASSRRLAVVDLFATGDGKYMSYVWDASLLSGALGEPLVRLETCSGARSPLRDLDLDGDLLAYARCDSGVGVLDFGPAAPVPVRTFDYMHVGAPRVAGRFLAVGRYVPERGVPELLLVDWTTGTELLRLDNPTYDFVGDYDVTPDGGLVVLRVTGPFDDSSLCLSPKRIVWHAPSSPGEQALPGRPCLADIAVAGGRVAYIAQSGPDRMALATVSFAGESRTIADLGPPGMLSGGMAFDAERAAYGLKTCDRRVQIKLAAVAGTPAPEPVGCPVAVRSRRAPVRGGRAIVRLRCRKGCSGEARVVRRRRGRVRALGRSVQFVFAGSQRPRAVELPLSRATRRRLARRGRLAAAVEVTAHDRAERPRTVRRAVLIVAASS